ncbi:MAG: carboxymuconolactone decarboxylase family protein [Chloroflexaceae bacterium]|nr:carboxymuconolactone decarboxylase family protein [Chloroflexaceae bacterium]
MSSTSRPASFRKRYYRGIAPFWSDLRHLASLRGRGSISAALRERLMLTVTAVNRCRYCAAFHGYVAQISGLAPEEVRRLLEGDAAAAPAAELPALLYARQWAEAGGAAPPELRAQLATIYGAEQARAIERALRMIWIGNLLGNTWDALLFRCSGGRFGGGR